MNDSIIDLLNLKGDDLVLTGYDTSYENEVIVNVQKAHRLTNCPLCGSALYSKGSDIRKLNHPILQDNRHVTVHLKKMKYKCSNPDCSYFTSDSFAFAPKGKHSTQILPLLILKEFKNINTTATDVANRLSVSDTTVYKIFEESVDFKRLPLSSVISIDEVYMNTDSKHKYAMVILDFLTGEPIDILESRRESDTNPYFRSIPREERDTVKYLICDMYNPYISFTKRYFTNAIAVIDCFHVISWINDRLNTYYNGVKREYVKEQQKDLKDKNYLTNREYKSKKPSRELQILKNFKYFLMSKKSNIDYSAERTHVGFLNECLDENQKEKMFFDLDEKFEIFRDLKEKYFEFDEQAKEEPGKAAELLDNLIDEYASCGQKIFSDFSEVIKKHRQYILNSYTFVEVTDRKGNKVTRRLSNGPIEQFNTNPKSLRRLARGIKNFDYARNRLLWALRSQETIPVRKSTDHVKRKGKKRGKYKKK